jgi:hypothetical protein
MPTDNHQKLINKKLRLLSRVFQDQQEKMRKTSMPTPYIISQQILQDHGGNLMIQQKEFSVIMQLIMRLHMIQM